MIKTKGLQRKATPRFKIAHSYFQSATWAKLVALDAVWIKLLFQKRFFSIGSIFLGKNGSAIGKQKSLIGEKSTFWGLKLFQTAFSGQLHQILSSFLIYEIRRTRYDIGFAGVLSFRNCRFEKTIGPKRMTDFFEKNQKHTMIHKSLKINQIQQFS